MGKEIQVAEIQACASFEPIYGEESKTKALRRANCLALWKLVLSWILGFCSSTHFCSFIRGWLVTKEINQNISPGSFLTLLKAVSKCVRTVY
jgi:hypothetical protein